MTRWGGGMAAAGLPTRIQTDSLMQPSPSAPHGSISSACQPPHNSALPARLVARNSIQNHFFSMAIDNGTAGRTVRVYRAWIADNQVEAVIVKLLESTHASIYRVSAQSPPSGR